MKNKLSSILFSIGILILIFSGLLYFFNTQTKQDPATTHSELLETNSNNIGIGMYDENNRIIDNGSTLEVSNGIIHSRLSLTHSINNKREYKIIALNNFIQTPFKVNGEQYTSYDLQTNANETIDINISHTTNENTKEVDYLFIKKPNFFLEEFKPEAIGSLQQIMGLRYNLNTDIMDFEMLKKDSLPPSSILNEGPIDNVFISEKEDELNALMVSKSGQDIYLTVGNPSNNYLQYAVIAFLDWEQVPFSDNQFIIYVGVQPGEKKVYKLQLPFVKTKTNYQIIAFPNPYEVSKSNYPSQSIEASIRTVIQP